MEKELKDFLEALKRTDLTHIPHLENQVKEKIIREQREEYPTNGIFDFYLEKEYEVDLDLISENDKDISYGIVGIYTAEGKGDREYSSGSYDNEEYDAISILNIDWDIEINCISEGNEWDLWKENIETDKEKDLWRQIENLITKIANG